MLKWFQHELHFGRAARCCCPRSRGSWVRHPDAHQPPRAESNQKLHFRTECHLLKQAFNSPGFFPPILGMSSSRKRSRTTLHGFIPNLSTEMIRTISIHYAFNKLVNSPSEVFFGDLSLFFLLSISVNYFWLDGW